MTTTAIEIHLNNNNYDIRKTNDARWFDQKCTPDVISFIAECILSYCENTKNEVFTVTNIWDSHFFNTNVQFLFGKPNPTNVAANREYDKFISQPLKMLSYAKILTCKKIGNKNYFSIANQNILNYVSAKDIHAYHFLHLYINKVLKDSGLQSTFFKFFDKCKSGTENRSDLINLRNSFELFIIENTRINKALEPNRIFNKVLNPLAVFHGTRGAARGNLSRAPLRFSDLMYNEVNWRDTLKSKSTTRKEYEELANNDKNVSFYSGYLVQKAIAQIKRRHGVSEVTDDLAAGEATQVHHIFMKHEYPNLAHKYENLIRLTPSQHLTRAHPNNQNMVVNPEYQLICLIAKLKNIEQSIEQNDNFYMLSDFIFIVNEALNLELSAEMNINTIREILIKRYK